MKYIPPAVLTMLAVAATSPPARADGFTLGDAANYAVLYEGGGGATLNFSNFGITGNIGVGPSMTSGMSATGKFADAGGCVGNCLITGSVDFAFPNTGQFSTTGGTTITGGVNYSVTAVTSALNTVNSLSQSLGLVGGTSVTIAGGGSLNTITNPGTLSGGNLVYTASLSSNFTAGTAFTITGDGTHNIVLNLSTTGVGGRPIRCCSTSLQIRWIPITQATTQTSRTVPRCRLPKTVSFKRVPLLALTSIRPERFQ